MKVCCACNRCFDDTAESCVEIGHPQLPDPRPGHRQMVPGYSLDQLFAASNKADVYLARRIDCDRLCLIGIVAASVEEGEAFLRDAGIAAGVFDARVADIYEAGPLESGQYFVVEEFVDGQTLRGQLESAGTPEMLVSIRIVEQVAEALHALHLAGLKHGAVRPDNIFVSFDDEGRPAIKLSGIDLGGVIARNIIANKFVIDSALDSIRYFAPEQCSGAAACPQTDVYSLGVVLYELLAGEPPFDAPKAVALMEMHRTERPPEVMIDDLDLRMLVAHGLSESLQKQPSFRQSTADLFARQMRHIEQLATHVSTPPPAVTVPAMPVTPSHAATVSPSVSNVPAPERGRSDSFGTAYGRAPDATFNIENEPAAPAFEPMAVYEDIVEPPVGFEVGSEPGDPTNLASEVTGEVIPEQCESFDIPGIELPVHKVSALAERRHRMRRWKRNFDPVEEPYRESETQPGSDPEKALISRLGQSVAFDFSQPVEEVSAEPLVMPKLVDWQQPDDIPSIDEIETVPSQEFAAFEQPFSVSVAVADPAPVTASPHLIEWEQPEDDIPSIEEVKEARSKEAITEVPAINFTPEDSDVVAAIQRRISAEAYESERSRSSETEAAPAPRPAIDVDFVPTILGERHRHEDDRPRPQFASILNAEAHQASRSIPYRSISIGLLLMAVAAAIGLGGDPLWRYFTAPEPSRSVAEVPAKQERPIQSMRPARVEPPPPESEPTGEVLEAIPEYEGPTAQPLRPRQDVPKARPRGRVRRGTVANENQRAENTPFEPSTLVITYGKGGVQSSNSAHKNSREKESRPPGEKTRGATRPRIVANPQ